MQEGADGLFGMTASSLRGLDEIQLQRRLVEAVHGRTYVFDLSIVPQKAVEVIRCGMMLLAGKRLNAWPCCRSHWPMSCS